MIVKACKNNRYTYTIFLVGCFRAHARLYFYSRSGISCFPSARGSSLPAFPFYFLRYVYICTLFRKLFGIMHPILGNWKSLCKSCCRDLADVSTRNTVNDFRRTHRNMYYEYNIFRILRRCEIFSLDNACIFKRRVHTNRFIFNLNI